MWSNPGTQFTREAFDANIGKAVPLTINGVRYADTTLLAVMAYDVPDTAREALKRISKFAPISFGFKPSSEALSGESIPALPEGLSAQRMYERWAETHDKPFEP